MLTMTRVNNTVGAGLCVFANADATASGNGKHYVSDRRATEKMTSNPTGFEIYESSSPGCTKEMLGGTLLLVLSHGNIRRATWMAASPTSAFSFAAPLPGLGYNQLLATTFEHPVKPLPSSAGSICSRDGRSMILGKSMRCMFEGVTHWSAITDQVQEKVLVAAILTAGDIMTFTS